MRRVTLLAICFCFLLLHAPARTSAKEHWVRVRSRNFLLVGNVNEKEIRRVALHLEQFREAITRLFPQTNSHSAVPTTVVIFGSERSYRPFKPKASTAGYFQSGPDVNYLTLTTELQGDQDPISVILHEYSHLLMNNVNRKVPTWFGEGLAECYSTFNISKDRKVVLGGSIASHVRLLRQKSLLPLKTLFQVDTQSPYYNEQGKKSLFYAQSWALTHYLLLGHGGRRAAQLNKFVGLVSENVPLDQTFQQSFDTTFTSMENELRDYIRVGRFPVVAAALETKLGFASELQSGVLTEAEAQAYLGDLLLHCDRPESEAYLRRALALDPNLAMAHASLGMLQAQQGKHEEARRSLERAVAISPDSYLIRYNYAYVISRAGSDLNGIVTAYTAEVADTMRKQLRKAIELKPDFLESYDLLAFVNLVTNYELDESIGLLNRAIAKSPGSNDLVLMLAQIYMRKHDYVKAREVLEDARRKTSDAQLKLHVKDLLARVASTEEARARFNSASDGQSVSSVNELSAEKPAEDDSVIENFDPAHHLRVALKPPAEGETQVQGTLLRIDCHQKGIMFVVKVADEVLNLRTAAFKHVFLKSFSSDAGRELTCGPRNPENNIVINYIRAPDLPSTRSGIAKSIEFVPKDFKLDPAP
jgi:tetratricopeptide (TPR) repeat protein